MRRLLLSAIAVSLFAVCLTACGGSSKPSYCGKLDKLEKSVKGFSVTGGLSGVKDQLQTIDTNARAVVSSAKSDFPDQTQAINTAANKLQTDIKAIPSSPSASQLASAAGDVKSLVDAVTSFASASKSKCS